MIDFLASALFNIYVWLFVLIFFGLCIFVHELGHFLAAKWRGMHIIAFSLGFKKVWGYKYKGVEYRIGCIPFGGYVDLPQIDASGQPKDENGNPLPPATPLDKIVTAFAGPFFNILFGLALGMIIWLHGIPMDTPKMTSFEVAFVAEESPEFKAGLRKGDIVETVNGSSFRSTWNDIIRKILFTVGDVELGIRRGGEKMKIKYLPVANKKVMPEEGIAYPYFFPKIPVVLVPIKKSPAEKAGLKMNDVVLKVDGAELSGYDEFYQKINDSAGRPMVFTISRHGNVFDVKDIVAKEEKLAGIYRIGVKYNSEPLPIVLGEIIPGSPAAQAGLAPGDAVQKINGKTLTVPEMFSSMVQQSKGAEMEFTVTRGGEEKIIKVTAKPAKEFTIGVEEVFYNFPNPLQQFADVIDMTYKSLRGMASNLFWKNSSTLSPKHMSGPVGIFAIIGKAVYHGHLIQAIYIIVMITFSLALINLFPIPVLDGGHIVLAIIESARGGKPVPEAMIKPIFIVFVVLLIGMMIFVTLFDFKRHILPKPKPAATASEALKEVPATEAKDVKP
ncbi:MAG TPA: hypothetical protein DCZ94_21380 [Lentisphaeria bacterium]|nr:MAG: hypothetical protein A2X48_19205 [Lentisphaerae bacterium GWF2_49_21]HBC89498.1 hypothetical protein [Lentisphaeria bacterium]